MTEKAPLAVLICNLGTPEAPTPKAVRSFLKPFLSDRRVVEVPHPLWMLILHGVILPFRPTPVARGYQALWDEYGDSPLRIFTLSQVEKLREVLAEQRVLVDYAFTYGEPGIAHQLDTYRELAQQVVLLPLYPQYSCSTTAAVYDQAAAYNLKQRHVMDVAIVKDYYRAVSYRKALAESVQAYWASQGKGDHLLMSYHGVPQAYADKGDPYYQQCLDTSANLARDLGLAKNEYTISFQSRLGKAQWLQPYTDVTVRELAASGINTLDVVCPSFSVDCLETLEEITVENGDYFTEAGGKMLRLIPCLNDTNSHIAMMADIIAPFIHRTHHG